MTHICSQLYAIGKISSMKTNKICCIVILSKDSIDYINKVATLYYAASYEHERKRNNSFCVYLEDGSFYFAQIVLFVFHPKPCVIINKISTEEHSSGLTQQAGYAGYARNRKLDNHQKVDILNEFIPKMKKKQSESPAVIDFMNLAILIRVGSQQYISALVNPYEFH